jgi:hypothetical protein
MMVQVLLGATECAEGAPVLASEYAGVAGSCWLYVFGAGLYDEAHVAP